MKKIIQHLLPLVVVISITMTIIPYTALAQEPSVEANKKIIKEGFDRWTNGTGSFFDLLTDDMQWQITGSTVQSKTYNGKKQFIDEVIAPLNQRFSKKIVPAVKFLFGEKDWVIALWEGKATAADGKPYDMSYAWFMQMKAGKITNVIAFLDGIKFDDILRRIPVQQ